MYLPSLKQIYSSAVIRRRLFLQEYGLNRTLESRTLANENQDGDLAEDDFAPPTFIIVFLSSHPHHPQYHSLSMSSPPTSLSSLSQKNISNLLRTQVE